MSMINAEKRAQNKTICTCIVFARCSQYCETRALRPYKNKYKKASFAHFDTKTYIDFDARRINETVAKKVNY